MESNTETVDSFTTWKDVLAAEKTKPYFKELLSFVEQRRASGMTVYPPNSEVFNALHLTPFDAVKVVILGQDPYHGPNQAHGLCFSVKDGVQPPPSLINIFKELNNDVGAPFPRRGNLEKWARQGVLLLNSVLTVESGQPESHANRGWETFTDTIIYQLNTHRTGVVFLLWGSYAQRKGAVIDPLRHLVLKAPHPSPLSAHRGFLGCGHFSKANEFIRSRGGVAIDWDLTTP